MIYNLIGSGILVAVGAGLGGACVWLSMASGRVIDKLAVRRARREAEEVNADLSDSQAWRRHHWKHLTAARDTIARQTDLIGQLQYKRDKTLEYCKQFRVRGAVVAGILSGEQDQ